MLQGQVQQMQQQNTDLNAKVAKLEQDLGPGNGELLKLRESFQKLQEEADKQQKRKEKLDKELKDMRQGLEAKQSEVNAKREELSRGEEVQKHLSRVLREEKQEEERLGIRCTQLNGNAQHLDKQVREEMTAKNRLEEEQKDLKAQLKFRQDEINALRSSKAKTQKTLEALQALKDKDDAESRRLEAPHPRERSTSPVGEWKRLNGMPSCEESLRARSTQMRGEVSELRKELEKLKRDSEAQEKQVTDLLHERDILGKALMKGEERSKQQVELDLHRWKSDLDLKLQRIHELDRQREKYSGDLQQAKQRCEAAQEELRGLGSRELQMAQLKRSIADVRAKWAQQKNLYEAVRTDKNLYSKNLVESLEEINEMRKKFKVMCHQIEQLKEEIKEKDTKHNLEYHEKQQTRAQQLVEQQSSDIKKLEATIQEAESERQNQRKEFEAVTAERNILGKQLIRRNEELSLIYEKIKIQERALIHWIDGFLHHCESTLSKGEVQYRKLLDRLHEQRTDIGELKRDLFIARQQAESAGSLEKEVYHLQRELLQERTKVRALSEELENPMNVHRWRKLEGSDPGMYELIQKVRSLQMRLIAKTEEVVVKDSEIQEKDKLHKELNAILEKQPGPEVLEQLEQYQEHDWRARTYNSKLKQMKAMQGELQTYQSQVSDYKDEIDRLNRELQDAWPVKQVGGPAGRWPRDPSSAGAAGSLYGRLVQPGALRQPATAARSQHRAARPAAPAAGAGGAGARPVPVITLPKDKEAEHYVIHSDVSTPSAHRARVDGRRVVSVRRRRSEAERKPSPVERRRSSRGA
eukprot:g23366.t1